ncbi:MAG: hydroxyisourate hydrolase [Woeseiaceae bacterium]|nr:hydroxyisourate hydrolase [Woeseiaceae bacterium]
MARLTTHVLDTAGGRPGAGITVRLYRRADDRRQVAEAVTNADGRTDEPLLAGDAFEAGAYELEFDVGDYFGDKTAGRSPAFLQTVLIRVHLAADENYHVPLLVSPWSYTTYRGS